MGIGALCEANADLVPIASALAVANATSVAGHCPEELSERNVVLNQLTQQLAALRIETVDQSEHVDVGALTDQRNTANHVASVCNADPAPVRADALLGRWLRDFPVLRQAFVEGRVGVSHLDLLRKADNVRVHHQMIQAQDSFVQWFHQLAFRDLPHLIDRWLLGADPDGAAPDEHAKKTGLSLTPLPGGMVKVSGLLDPLQGAALRDAVNFEEQKLRRTQQQHGVTSTVRQRMLEALLNLVGRGVARPDGSMPIPHVNIAMSQQVFEQTAAWLRDETEPFPHIDPMGQDPDAKCQLIDGTPIHPLYGFAAQAIATMRRIVYSAKGRPVEVSTKARSIPKWMAEAQLVATNGKCSNPVCDAPFSWLHADHITPHSHTQNTSVKNTRPLCEPDNLWRNNNTKRGIWNQADEGT